LEVIVGSRYEFARARADSVQDPTTGNRIRVSDEWDAAVGSGRLVYHVDKAGHWNLYGGASQAFRAPNLSDLTRLDEARTNELETPSPNLEPEHFLTYEVGAKAEYEAFDLQMAYFYTTIRDMIIRVPTGQLIGANREVTKQNGGDGFVHGVEVEPRVRFWRDFTAFGSLTWMDGDVTAFPTSAPVKRREPISRLMPTTGRLGLRWDHPNRKFWVEGETTLAGSAHRLSTQDALDTSRIPPGGTPAYAVASIRAGWKVREHLTVTVALENITNEDYRIHGSGLNEPGRNLILGLDMTF